MRDAHVSEPDTLKPARAGVCLTDLSVAALVGGAVAVAAMLWLCIAVVL